MTTRLTDALAPIRCDSFKNELGNVLKEAYRLEDALIATCEEYGDPMDQTALRDLTIYHEAFSKRMQELQAKIDRLVADRFRDLIESL